MKRNRRNDCLFLKQEIGKQAAQECRKWTWWTFCLAERSLLHLSERSCRREQIVWAVCGGFSERPLLQWPPGCRRENRHRKTSVFSKEYWQNVKTLWSYSSPIYFLLLTAWMSCFVCSTQRKHPPVWKKNRISHALKRTFLPCLWVAFWMTTNWASLRIVLMRLNFHYPCECRHTAFSFGRHVASAVEVCQ